MLCRLCDQVSVKLVELVREVAEDGDTRGRGQMNRWRAADCRPERDCYLARVGASFIRGFVEEDSEFPRLDTHAEVHLGDFLRVRQGCFLLLGAGNVHVEFCAAGLCLDREESSESWRRVQSAVVERGLDQVGGVSRAVDVFRDCGSES